MPYCFDNGADPSNPQSQAFYTGDMPRAMKEAMRNSIMRDAQGYYAENYPRNAASAGQIGITGTIYFATIGLLAGDLVSNIHSMCSTLGSSLTLTKCGLYTTGGSLLASSADVSSTFGTTGPKVVPMATPYRVLVNGAYLIAFISTGTTIPTLMRTSNGSATSGAFTGGVALNQVQTGQTDLGASQTPAVSGSNIAFWFGIS